MPQQGVIHNDLVHPARAVTFQPATAVPFCTSPIHCWGKPRHGMTLPGLKTNRTTTHNTAHNPHSNPTPEWLHLPQQYEPGEKSRVPSAVPDHCRPPELCPSVSCALSCVPVSAERVPGSGVPHSSHPCLPGCTWARTHAKKPPIIPLTSALPRNRSRPGIHRTRKSLSSSHSKGWDGMNSFPAQLQDSQHPWSLQRRRHNGQAGLGWMEERKATYPRTQRWEAACVQAG